MLKSKITGPWLADIKRRVEGVSESKECNERGESGEGSKSGLVTGRFYLARKKKLTMNVSLGEQ